MRGSNRDGQCGAGREATRQACRPAGHHVGCLASMCTAGGQQADRRLASDGCHAQEDWLPKAAAAITERMGRYAASEVKVGNRPLWLGLTLRLACQKAVLLASECAIWR